MDGLICDWSCEAVDYVAGRRSANVVDGACEWKKFQWKNFQLKRESDRRNMGSVESECRIEGKNTLEVNLISTLNVNWLPYELQSCNLTIDLE